MTNYYKTLGVKKTATQEEIKTAYKSLVKKYHPDLYQGDKAYAERKTKELNAAYETLSDSELREAYDYELFPPPPGAGYYSSSSDNYSYTPPKYDTPPTDYYSKYKNQYSNPGKEYNYNDFANYHADKRYTDYHRSKVPNSDYKDQRPDDVPSKMMNIFDTLSNSKKFFAIILVIIVYCILFITTLSKFTFIFSGNANGPLLNEKTPTQIYKPEVQEPEPENVIPPRESFDINSYMTDDELETLYNGRFKDQFDTFEEFKKAFSDTLYDHYYGIE